MWLATCREIELLVTDLCEACTYIGPENTHCSYSAREWQASSQITIAEKFGISFPSDLYIVSNGIANFIPIAYMDVADFCFHFITYIKVMKRQFLKGGERDLHFTMLLDDYLLFLRSH